MGLLDDAIREHLELKRRRGGDPADIERAEREALGPVRREPEPIAPAGFDEPEGVEHELADEYDEAPAGYDLPYHDAEPEGFEDDLYARPPGALPPEPEPPLPHGAVGVGPEEPASGREDFGFDPEEDPWVASAPSGPARGAMPDEHAEPDVSDAPHRDPLPEPAAGPAPVSPPPEALPDHLNQETVEYRLEPEPHAAPPHPAEPQEGEDVLEETPEFLQDAPEHDRLWFEQRPPRDFDFDS